MLTSDFTLEILPSSGTLSIPPEQMPEQLRRIAVPESTWESVYAYASGLAERKSAREAAKKQLGDALNAEFSGVSLGISKRREQKHKRRRAETEEEKAEHDGNTRIEWNASLSEHGVSARLLGNPKVANSEFGVDFRCDAGSRLGPTALELRFDPRRCGWTWPRDEVPGELASRHVDAQSWTRVWDEADAALRGAIVLERQKKDAQNKINGVSVAGSEGGHAERAIRYASKLVQHKHSLLREQEFGWGELRDSVDDVMFLWGISVRLMRHECQENLGGYCGLLFRFRPMAQTTAAAVPTVPATVATAI